MTKEELKELYPTKEELPEDRGELEAIADALEVKYQQNTGDEKIKDRIAEVLLAREGQAKNASAFKVINQRKNRLSIKGVSIEPKGEHEITEEDLKNELLMKKIHHAINTGVLKKA